MARTPRVSEEVLRRNIDNEAKRHYYASQRMRDAAFLLDKQWEAYVLVHSLYKCDCRWIKGGGGIDHCSI